MEHIKKYRSLDSYGQETVNIILEREASRTATLSKKDSRITELENTLTDMSDYSYLNAAHDNGVTEEQKAAVDKIMMDDTEWE